jgi:hypothetical protein
MSTGVSPCSFSSTGVVCSTGQPTATGQYPSVCQGDSGGPQILQKTNIQVGINSFVRNTVNGCGSNTYTGMTSVSYFRAGIQNIIDTYGIISDIQEPRPSPPPEINTETTPPEPPAPMDLSSPPPPLLQPPPSPLPPGPLGKLVCISHSMYTVKNRRYFYAQLIRPSYTVRAFNTCSRNCLEDTRCNTFQYFKRTRVCFLFSTRWSSIRYDTRFSGGFKYCRKYAPDIPGQF